MKFSILFDSTLSDKVINHIHKQITCKHFKNQNVTLFIGTTQDITPLINIRNIYSQAIIRCEGVKI